MARKVTLPGDRGAVPATPTDDHCRLEFLRYEPSQWETRWKTGAAELQDKVCATMVQEAALTEAWMAPMDPSFAADAAATDLPGMQGDEVNPACWPVRTREACKLSHAVLMAASCLTFAVV